MKCPLCNNEARIVKTSNVLRIVDGVPKLFVRQTYKCFTKQCDNFDKELGTVETEIPVSIVNEEPEESVEA